MKIALEPRASGRTPAEVCICFVVPGEVPDLPGVAPAALRNWMKEVRFGGRLGELEYHPSGGLLPRTGVLVAGLGHGTPELRHLKRAAACAARRLHGLHITSVHVTWPATLPAPEALRSLVVGLRRGAYRFRAYRDYPPRPPIRVRVLAPSNAANRKALAAALAISDAFDLVADLANAGGNDTTPARITRFAQEHARRHRLRCTVWDHRRLAKEGCRAHAAVGQGSANPPCLIRLDYRPRRARGPLVALVGKTITFDSGGLSIKPAKSMESMKYDKCGGMAVLAVMLAAARLGVDRPLTAFLAVAENMTGSRAQRPGDIVRTRRGHTVEVLNTDAEGRLVLADALDVAADLKPAALIDLATLTGAAVTAVGRECSAVLGQGDTLIQQLTEAGERCGERLWRLPLYAEYRPLIRSAQADLRNIGDGTAGTIVGGIFLQHFVPNRQPWAHLDLTHAWEERDQAHAAAGATLFGAHLILDWLLQGAPA